MSDERMSADFARGAAAMIRAAATETAGQDPIDVGTEYIEFAGKILATPGRAELYAQVLEAYAAAEEAKASPGVKHIYATLKQDITWNDIWGVGRVDVIAFHAGDKGILTHLDSFTYPGTSRYGITFNPPYQHDAAGRPMPEWIPVQFLTFTIE